MLDELVSVDQVQENQLSEYLNSKERFVLSESCLWGDTLLQPTFLSSIQKLLAFSLKQIDMLKLFVTKGLTHKAITEMSR